MVPSALLALFETATSAVANTAHRLDSVSQNFMSYLVPPATSDETADEPRQVLKGRVGTLDGRNESLQRLHAALRTKLTANGFDTSGVISLTFDESGRINLLDPQFGPDLAAFLRNDAELTSLAHQVVDDMRSSFEPPPSSRADATFPTADFHFAPNKVRLDLTATELRVAYDAGKSKLAA